MQTEEGYTEIQHPLMEFSNELGLGTGNITSYGRTVYAISLTKAAESLDRSIGMHLLVEAGPAGGRLAKQKVSLSLLRLPRGHRHRGVQRRRHRGRRAEAAGRRGADQERRRRAGRRGEAEGPGLRSAARRPDDDGRRHRHDASTDGAERAALAEKGISTENWWAVTTLKYDAYRTDRVGSGRQGRDRGVGHRRRRQDLRDHHRRGRGRGPAPRVHPRRRGGPPDEPRMRQLRNAAFGIAEQRLPMLVDQLSRTDPGRVDTRVAPIPITTTDEIGEVARAFDQVHREAVRLAAEQALLRGNINAIFTNLSRRNQSLIEGQLTLITDLENNEADPDQLENLFRLDHLATRMRRNGENLLVLAGEEPGRRWDQPVPLVDVLRAASSEVEQYERIELSGVPEAEIHGRAVTDLVHLLAELLENATTFSSPQTKVRVTATRLPDGRVMVEIHDKGIGLDRRGLRGHQPQAGQPADRGRRDLPAHGPVRGRPAGRPARHPRPAASLGRAGRHHLAGHAARTRSRTVAAASEQLSRTATSSPSRRSSRSSSYGRRRGLQHRPADAHRRRTRLRRQPLRGPATTSASLDPVGRSLMREERRAALEAQTGRPAAAVPGSRTSPRSRRRTARATSAAVSSRATRPGRRLRPPRQRRSRRLRQRRDRLRRAARRVRPADGVPGAAAPGVRRAVLPAERRRAAGRLLRRRRTASRRRERLLVERRLPGPRVCGARPGGADAPPAPSEGFQPYEEQQSYQDDWPQETSQHDGYQNGYPDQYAPEAESTQVADAGEQNRVGFDRPGPSSSASHALTEAGLPRRGSTASGPNAPHGTATKQEAPATSPAEQRRRSTIWRSANDERWQRAEPL